MRFLCSILFDVWKLKMARCSTTRIFSRLYNLIDLSIVPTENAQCDRMGLQKNDLQTFLHSSGHNVCSACSYHMHSSSDKISNFKILREIQHSHETGISQSLILMVHIMYDLAWSKGTLYPLLWYAKYEILYLVQVLSIYMSFFIISTSCLLF